ncbi:MAG: ABC transporter permease [Desulfobacterales bacterium]
MITVGVAVVHSFIGMAVLVFLEAVFGDGIHWTLVYLPLIYLPLIFVTGISWILAAFGVFSRDIDNLMQSLIQMLFLLSGIIFPLERLMGMVPEAWHWVLRLVSSHRWLMMHDPVVLEGAPDWYWLMVNLVARQHFWLWNMHLVYESQKGFC